MLLTGHAVARVGHRRIFANGDDEVALIAAVEGIDQPGFGVELDGLDHRLQHVAQNEIALLELDLFGGD